MPPFNWFDLCIIGVMGLSGLVGLVRGVIKEAFILASWVVAIWLSVHYGKLASSYLTGLIDIPSIRTVAGFAAVFVGAWTVSSAVGYLLARVIHGAGLSGLDKMAGLVFGVARGVLVVVVLVFLARETPFIKDPWWHESRLVPVFQSLAMVMVRQIPPGYMSQIGLQDASH